MKKICLHDIICPLCGGNMVHMNIEGTYTWSCEDCPSFLIEYYDDSNFKDLIGRLK